MGEQQHEVRAGEVRAVFTEALALAAPDERARYLDEACRDKPALRERVEALLRAYEQATGFLKQDALGGDPDALESSITEGPGTVIGRYRAGAQVAHEG